MNSYDVFKCIMGVLYDSETMPHFRYTDGVHGEAKQVRSKVRGVAVTSKRNYVPTTGSVNMVM